MFKIVNNRIYLNSGDTPTYDSEIIYRDGSPFRIGETINNPHIEFIVRASIYDKDDEYIFRYLFSAEPFIFDSETLEEYPYEEFDDMVPGDEGKLYRAGEDNYAYWDGSIWVPYEARLVFNFDREDTKDLEPRKYYYQINLLGGSFDGSNFTNINYKKTLLDTSDFIVGGSLSE